MKNISMKDNRTKIEKAKEDVLLEHNAQTIFDRIKDLEKDSKKNAKRWFWELLQNAKDAVDNDSKVSVKVILEGHNLSFHHSGAPFNLHDVLHLILQGTTKKNQEGKTGRFGTGFMSTHLLSRKVNISGVLDDKTDFKFDSNREASSLEQ